MFKAIAAFFKKIFKPKPVYPPAPVIVKPENKTPEAVAKEIALKDLPWMKIAYGYVGLHETKGPGATKKIADWLAAVGMARNDEIAWCAAAANGILREAGYKQSGRANARSLLNVGETLPAFKPGAIVILWRGSIQGWEGHVGFAEKLSADGKQVRILGGNQGNEFNSSWFSADRVLGYRYPVKA